LLFADQVLDIPVILLADILDQLTAQHYRMGGEFPGPGVCFLIVNGVFNLEVSQVDTAKSLNHVQSIGSRKA
jgi:hypothetical protein